MYLARPMEELGIDSILVYKCAVIYFAFLDFLLQWINTLGLPYILIVRTLHNFTKPNQCQQCLTLLLRSLIKIIMKSQGEESKTPDHSKINQLKPRIRLTRLHANSNPCLIYVQLIFKYSISLNHNPSYL